MRFSEAVRLGALMHPQSFGGMRDSKGGTCALGSALDAIGALTSKAGGPGAMDDFIRIMTIWPALGKRAAVPCPAGCSLSKHFEANRTTAMVWHLNDRHSWTREAIADWYELTFESTELTHPSAEQITKMTPAFQEVQDVTSTL